MAHGVMIVATALLATIAVTPPAEAHHQDSDRIVEASTKIARAAWPDTPCEGRETIRRVDRHGGWAWFDGSCTIDMPAAPADQPARWCSILVHEFGHLAGWIGHSPDPMHVMHKGAPTQPACKIVEDFRTRFHPLAAAREQARERTSHAWSCVRASRRLARCSGKPRGDARLRGRIEVERSGENDAWSMTVRYFRP